MPLCHLYLGSYERIAYHHAQNGLDYLDQVQNAIAVYKRSNYIMIIDIFQANISIVTLILAFELFVQDVQPLI